MIGDALINTPTLNQLQEHRPSVVVQRPETAIIVAQAVDSRKIFCKIFK